MASLYFTAWHYQGKGLFYHIYYVAGHDNNYTHVASQKHDIIELELQEEVTLCS